MSAVRPLSGGRGGRVCLSRRAAPAVPGDFASEAPRRSRGRPHGARDEAMEGA